MKLYQISAIVFFLAFICCCVAAAAQQDEYLSAHENAAQMLEKKLFAGNQPPVPESNLSNLLKASGFTPDQINALTALVPTEDDQHVTAMAMYNKVLEGMAKGVQPDRIVKASQRVKERYAYASALSRDLELNTRQPATQLYADCLAAGLTREDVAKISTALHRENRADNPSTQLVKETLTTARDMVRQGISSTATAGLMEAALINGFQHEEMRRLRHSFRYSDLNDVHEKANRYRHAIASGVQMGELEREQNRFNSGENDGTGQKGGSPENSGNSGSSTNEGSNSGGGPSGEGNSAGGAADGGNGSSSGGNGNGNGGGNDNGGKGGN